LEENKKETLRFRLQDNNMSEKETLESIRQEFENEGYQLLTTIYKNSRQKLEYICPNEHKGTIAWVSWQQGCRCLECSGKKKKDVSFIRKEFEKEGYQLLTTDYVNNVQKLEYICPKGHIGTIRWGDWSGGHRCAECVGCKKKDINFIRQEFEKEGYQLLTKEYKNSSQKLEYICPKGHIGTIVWGNWQQGARCAECNGTKRKDINFIKQEFEKEGYQLLTTIYKNSKQKLEYICPKEHRSSITWSDWNSGKRCAECSGKKKKDINFIRQEFKKEGYELLTKEYINSSQKLEYICPKGHRSSITWGNWTSNYRCKLCADIVLRKDVESVRQAFEKEGYQLLTTNYKNSMQKLRYVCPIKHKGNTTWARWQQGHRCAKCANIISTPETKIFNFLLPYFPNIIHNDRKIIAPFELDIVISFKKVAIEYCGLYWHSELHGKDKNYHLNKLNKAKEQGYRLITIFEDEYLNHKEVVLDRLKIILGVSDAIKVNARDCIIKEIDTKVARIFCDTYHLQGYGNSKVKLGAYLNNELLSVMTFSKPSIAKGTKSSDSNTYELNRFCSKINYNIRGIASKLLIYFNRNYAPSLIISYADKRWSDGNLYKMLRFKYVYDSDPNYWYITQGKRFHRFNFRKNVLKEKLDEFDPNMSEWQNMINNGYDRIWDCGNMKFVLLI